MRRFKRREKERKGTKKQKERDLKQLKRLLQEDLEEEEIFEEGG